MLIERTQQLLYASELQDMCADRNLTRDAGCFLIP